MFSYFLSAKTHFCRLEGDTRCVVQIRVEFEGIPYSDTFAVEIRWVATKEGDRDIVIEVAVEVDFKKNTFLKSKIRAGTLEETAPIHKNLFEAIKSKCAAISGVERLPSESELSIVKDSVEPCPPQSPPIENMLGLSSSRSIVLTSGIVILFAIWWYSFSRIPEIHTSVLQPTNDVGVLLSRIQHLESEIGLVRETLSEVISILRKMQEDI